MGWASLGYTKYPLSRSAPFRLTRRRNFKDKITKNNKICNEGIRPTFLKNNEVTIHTLPQLKCINSVGFDAFKSSPI